MCNCKSSSKNIVQPKKIVKNVNSRKASNGTPSRRIIRLVKR